MTVMATNDQTNACPNCKGTGRIPDVRFAGVSHHRTVIRRKCRHCRGSGEAPRYVPPRVETESDDSAEIPDWMLDWEEAEEAQEGSL